MKWWKALWVAVMAFFAALRTEEAPDIPEEEYEVADKTDDQLESDAESLGLVQPKDSGRP
jgi:hypothetical protein